MTLSGIEVIKTGGKAGYTYFKEGDFRKHTRH